MIKITYNGPVGTHFVTSPLRLIATYGLHTRGDVFAVHKADQRARPDLFAPLVEHAPQPVADAIETSLVEGDVPIDDEEMVAEEQTETESAAKEVPVEPVVAVKKESPKKRMKKRG